MSDDQTNGQPPIRHWAEILAEIPDAENLTPRRTLTFELLGAIGRLEGRLDGVGEELVWALKERDAALQRTEAPSDDSEAHRRQLALGGLLSGIMGDDPSMTVPTWNAAIGRVLSHLVSCALEIGMGDALVKELDERKAAFLAAREPAETEEPK